MRYIDKYRMHTAAHALNVLFLQDCYSGDIHNPIPSPANPDSSYDDFKKAKYRDGEYGWKNLLLAEQDVEKTPRCCYCMRKLNPQTGKINYEHIIPRSLSGIEGQTQYDYYSSHAPALRDHVMIANDFMEKSFVTTEDIGKEPRMPHTTALSNLVVACNGKRETFASTGCCCNGNRQDDKIMPIMLMPNADTDVVYDANGILIISCDDGTLKNITEELNDTTLQEIRSIWYHLSRVKKDLSHAVTMPIKERIEWFKTAYSTSDFTTLSEKIKKYTSYLDKDSSDKDSDTYWKLLLSYDWFYYYPAYAKQRN